MGYEAMLRMHRGVRSHFVNEGIMRNQGVYSLFSQGTWGEVMRAQWLKGEATQCAKSEEIEQFIETGPRGLGQCTLPHCRGTTQNI